MTLHTTRLLVDVTYTGDECLPAEIAAAIQDDVKATTLGQQAATVRVRQLDGATAMSVALLADIDAYLAKQPKDEPEGGDYCADVEGAMARGEEHGGWEVAQALRNIIAKHRYEAYVATCRRFGSTGVSFEKWADIQGATAGERAQHPSRVVG